MQWPDKLNAIIVVFPDEKNFTSDNALAGYSAQPILETK
jgi:hypothetical protein